MFFWTVEHFDFDILLRYWVTSASVGERQNGTCSYLYYSFFYAGIALYDDFLVSIVLHTPQCSIVILMLL